MKVSTKYAGLVIIILVLAVPAVGRNLGKIDFPTSGPPEAQKHFIEGVLYLHNFEFDDAREEFEKARELAPDFAMAYWGEAMSHNHPLWRQVDISAGRRALSRLARRAERRAAKAPTEREKGFLKAVEILFFADGDKTDRDLAYSEAMRELHERFPKDHEAASFYALSILGLTNGVRDFRNYMRAAAIVEEVFSENPRHPGAAHYLIHSYDDPIHAPLGLRPASVYAKIAPAASHAQHMVSHIYVALGRWDEAVKANEQAWAVSKARVKRKRLDKGQHDFHSYFWLHYSYLQQGRYEKAQAMLEVVEAAVRSGDRRRLGDYYSRMRSEQLIESRDWTVRLPPSDRGLHDNFADALVAIHTENLDTADRLLLRMNPDQIGGKIMRMEIDALLRHKKGDSQGALTILREAAAMEDEMPLSFGPPIPSKPSHELLGELLLELGHPAEAKQHFETALERTPLRALSLLGLARACERSGDSKLAAEIWANLREVWHLAEPKTLDQLETEMSGRE